MAEELEFAVGDLVTLKSGGPVMTVYNTGPLDNETWTIACQWFDASDHMFEHRFDQRVLEDYVEEETE